ncbi:MAG: serine/threonine-protein kinase [Polyangiaceae bacterium]
MGVPAQRLSIEWSSQAESLTRLRASGQRAEVAGYHTLFELGHGGMGSTWLAVTRDTTEFERLVVIKRLRAELSRDPEAMGRFMDEARTAACVHHANVVGIHQVGRDESGPFLVQDYIEGATLEQLLDWTAISKRPLNLETSLRIALDVARGLGAIHSAQDARGRPLGILHRDVSLQNILVGRDGVSRIADFGIAKSILASVATGRHDILGKLLYLPPEYLQRQVCCQALDVYSFGINLWMLLAGGRSPFRVQSDVQLVWAICEVGVPALRSSVPDVPAALAELVDQACARDVQGRFQNGQELARELERVVRSLGIMPSHDSVADVVEMELGETLGRRRARVATGLDRLETQGPTTDAGARNSDAVAESVLRSEPARPSLAADTHRPETTRRPRRLRVWTAILSLLVAVTASVLVLAPGGGAQPSLGPHEPRVPVVKHQRVQFMPRIQIDVGATTEPRTR